MSRKEPNKPLLHTNMYIMHVKRDQMKRKILLKMRRPAEQKYCSKYFQRMFVAFPPKKFLDKIDSWDQLMQNISPTFSRGVGREDSS